jgi:hypothetical protein
MQLRAGAKARPQPRRPSAQIGPERRGEQVAQGAIGQIRGGFLGAIVGAAMLFTVSWPAALVTLAAFLLASLVFVNVKG